MIQLVTLVRIYYIAALVPDIGFRYRSTTISHRQHAYACLYSLSVQMANQNTHYIIVCCQCCH